MASVSEKIIRVAPCPYDYFICGLEVAIMPCTVTSLKLALGLLSGEITPHHSAMLGVTLSPFCGAERMRYRRVHGSRE